MSQPRPRRTGRLFAAGLRRPGGLCTLVMSLIGLGLEDARAVEFAEVQHHAGETGEIRGGGEKRRVARDAAHRARHGVVHLSAFRRARWRTRAAGDRRAGGTACRSSAAGGRFRSCRTRRTSCRSRARSPCRAPCCRRCCRRSAARLEQRLLAAGLRDRLRRGLR